MKRTIFTLLSLTTLALAGCGTSATGGSDPYGILPDEAGQPRNPWTPPTPLSISQEWTAVGPPIQGSPDIAAAPEGGTLDLVALGGDDRIFHMAYAKNGGWQAPEILGGGVNSDPSIVAGKDGARDVFVRGTGFDILHNKRRGGAWSGFQSIGGPAYGGILALQGRDGTARSAPGAHIVRTAPDKVRVDVIGWDDAIWSREYDAAQDTWGAWTREGGQVFVDNGPPVGVTEHPAIADKHWYARDLQNKLISDAASLGGALDTLGVDADTDELEGAHVAARGMNKGLWVYYDPDKSPARSGWHDLGGIITSGPSIALYKDDANHAHFSEVVAARGQDGRTYLRGFTFDYTLAAPPGPEFTSVTITPVDAMDEALTPHHVYMKLGNEVNISFQISAGPGWGTEECQDLSVEVTRRSAMNLPEEPVYTWTFAGPGQCQNCGDSRTVKPTKTDNFYSFTGRCKNGGDIAHAVVYAHTWAPPSP